MALRNDDDGSNDNDADYDDDDHDGLEDGVHCCNQFARDSAAPTHMPRLPSQQSILTASWLQVPTALVMFKGEQHGFRGAPAIRAALEGEMFFYGKVTGAGGL